MKKLITYTKKIALFLGILMLFCFLLSIFNLIGLSKNASSIILFVINILLFFICGFIHGKKTQKKGITEGLKISLILVSIMFLISIIFYNYAFKLSNLIYYIILGLATITGCVFGKNKK